MVSFDPMDSILTSGTWKNLLCDHRVKSPVYPVYIFPVISDCSSGAFNTRATSDLSEELTSCWVVETADSLLHPNKKR